MIFLGRPRGFEPSFGGFPALARDEAAFFGDVRDAIIPMILPAPHLQMGQDSTCLLNAAMSHEPPASEIPMAAGSAPQNSLRDMSLTRPAMTAGEEPPEPPCISGELRRKSRPDKKTWAGDSRLLDGPECRDKRQPEMTGSLARQNPASPAGCRKSYAGLPAKLRREAGHGLLCHFSLRHGTLLRPTPFVVCGALFDCKINLSDRFVKKEMTLFLNILRYFISMRNCMRFVVGG
jgi:hypothetical protein